MVNYTETDMQKINQFCQEKNINKNNFLASDQVEYYDNIEILKDYYIFMYYEDTTPPIYLVNATLKQVCKLIENNYHHNYVLLLDDNRALLCLYADQVFK